MKKLLLTGIVIFFSFNAVIAQTKISELPKTSQDFIKKHFNAEEVVKVEKNDNWYNWDNDEMYEVRLGNGIKLDFNKAGNITEIDSKEGSSIPLDALPAPIVAYLNQSGWSADIVSWEKDGSGHEVQLADGRELEFDANGKFLKED